MEAGSMVRVEGGSRSCPLPDVLLPLPKAESKLEEIGRRWPGSFFSTSISSSHLLCQHWPGPSRVVSRMWIQGLVPQELAPPRVGTGYWEKAIVLAQTGVPEEAWRVPGGSLTHRRIWEGS